MPRGAKQLDRGTIHPRLREVIDRSVREGRFTLRVLGIAAGFPDPQTLSKQMHGEFPTSTLMLRRWKRVAEISGYDGDPIRREHE